MMAIAQGWPPNIEAIRARFDLAGKSPVFCWGRIVFVGPDGPASLDEALMHHEATHSIQQEEYGGVEKWWDRYLADPEFMLAEEVVAYRNQLAKFHELNRDRNARARFLHRIASDLSGPMYHRPCTYAEAVSLITKNQRGN